VKALHELGHAYATRARGGEVHEMGIMLLVLAPVPYVDATASYGFPSKWRRAQVGVAGMWVEVLLAALAMYVWLLVEPGPVRTVAYNVMVIGGVSTLLFNGNPLLRFDGYYVLSDLVEIPNMGPRANRYLAYLVERYWFRLRHAEAPIATRGERIWFVCYAPMAFVYRVFISMAVALFVATQFFVVGIAVALWSVAMLVGVPLYKTVSYFSRNPALGKRRARVVAATAGAVGVLALVLCAIPMPHSTRSEGVVWLPDDAVVRAGADGFVRRVAAAPGEPVRPGDLLIECDNPGLLAELRVLEAKVDEARARYDAQWTRDKVAAELARRELELAQSNLQRTQERASGLALLSQVSGVFILPDAQDLPGRYVRKGEPLGYVVTPERGLVRVVLEQRHVDLVRHWTRRVEVKLTHRLGETFEARIGREVPQASEDLPSAALGSLGGGRIATDPRDDHGTKTLQRVFQVDVALPPGAPIPAYGGRVYLRFQHEPEPLATQAYRAVRQLLLSRLDV
jgi:putative peptide zinc metalloprotease protein